MIKEPSQNLDNKYATFLWIRKNEKETVFYLHEKWQHLRGTNWIMLSN